MCAVGMVLVKRGEERKLDGRVEVVCVRSKGLVSKGRNEGQ